MALASTAGTAAPAVDPLLGAARRLSVGLLAGALAVGLAAQLLAPGALRAAAPALLVAAVAAGLPHGASDVSLLAARGRPRAAQAAYAVAALAALAVALALPGPALVVLLVLSVAHFAEGEQGWARAAGEPGALLPALAVGTAAVVLPLVTSPADVRPVLDDLAPAVGSAVAGGPVRLALAAVVVVLALAALRRPGRRAELVLVLAVLAALPPLVAFAVWFAGWHAVRHGARVLVAHPPERRKALVRTWLAPSLAAAAGLGALVAATGGVPAALVLGLLALTVPHAVVVATGLRRA